MLTQRPKGTQDWYGEDMNKRTQIEAICRDICKRYHVMEVSTPVFEHTILFARGVGETTDVVQKEMYTFMDKGDRSITLKPEGTAGTIRAFLENNMYAEPLPRKLFYVTPCFRYEQPQSGRFRQHHQFGVEFIGSKSPLVEVEIICILKELINRLGLSDVKLHLNSIGCTECRKIYNKALLSFLTEREEAFCGTCRERMQKNPLRVLDCKVPSCHEIMKQAPRTIDYLCEECQTHFDTLQRLLTEIGIDFVVDSGVVRGLDYYTKTVFEFINADGFTLCGGGRYDNLVHEIDEKQELPSVGFGIGLERILYFLQKEGKNLEPIPQIDLYVGILGQECTTKAYAIVKRLRDEGHIVETDYMERSVKAQMKYANKLAVKYSVVIGADELAAGEVSLKNMESGEAVTVKIDQLGAHLK